MDDAARRRGELRGRRGRVWQRERVRLERARMRTRGHATPLAVAFRGCGDRVHMLMMPSRSGTRHGRARVVSTSHTTRLRGPACPLGTAAHAGIRHSRPSWRPITRQPLQQRKRTEYSGGSLERAGDPFREILQ